MTRVSVVVCTYSKERLDYVVGCIESLKKQTLQPKEIILVLDKDKALVDFYESLMPSNVKIVVSNGFGLSNARNAGVKNVEGEVVAFIDDDAVADRDWLKNLVQNYEDPLVLGVGGIVKPLWEGKQPAWFPEELYWIVGCSYKGVPHERALVRNPLGCNMSFKRSVFDEVGYFDSTFGRIGKALMAGEEAEFSMRIQRMVPQAKIVFDPSALVYHMVPKSRVRLEHFFNRSFCEGFSKAIISSHGLNPVNTLLMEKNYMRNLLSVAIPIRLIRGYKPENLSQVLVILFSASLVVVGYLAGKLNK